MATTPKHSGQPEALATFAATARNAGHKPENIGLEATPATKPVATSPEAKQDAATRVLQEGVTGKDHGADEAIDALPDRAAGKQPGKA
jgi:hypothetical protein